MKKAVVSLIILLIAAGAVFYLGWVQFAVPAGSCGVMISKTGGVYSEPITSGKFIWRWERLLPTNTELRIFNLTPVTVAETITSSLPSAALYSTVIAGELDFSYSVEIKTTAKLAPDAVLQLVKKNDIKTQTELDTTVTSLIKQFNRTVVDFILQQESGVAADGISPLSFTTESLLDSIDVGNLFPGLEVTFEKTVHLIFPAPIRYVDLGSSNIIAEYGALYFSSIFNMAVRIEDPNNYPVAHMSPEIARRTCIVALSVSGETREIVDYLSHFNLTECSIISITSTGTSTVARLSDINIPYHITIEKVRDTLKDEPDITTQVPALYIVETLAREVIKQKADRQN